MPPSDYLSVSAINRALSTMPVTFPDLCTKIILPEKSIELRSVLAVKLAKGTGPKRRGVLFLGGVHARELINPDLLVALALKLCQAYTDGTGLTFGGKVFEADTIKLLIENLDIFIMPLVNPDGRAFVQQTTGGDAMWRKNRNPNPGMPCKGVDINRNFDFLHASGIDTSTNTCSLLFKGVNPFSEPETRNVRHMLDTFPNIMGMVDIHSYSELILYPWGDDNNQTTDPNMNFSNAAFNGLRGVRDDTVYREFIRKLDLDFFVKTADKMREATAAVRGRFYRAEQGVLLYPYSATSSDWAYSRNYVNASLRKVFAFAYETAREFQPPMAEAQNVMAEVSAGLLHFCTAMLCVAETTLNATALAAELDHMREFRDKELITTAAGRKYVDLFEDNGLELMRIMLDDEKLREQAIALAAQINEVVKSRKTSKPKTLSSNITGATDKLLKTFGSKAGPELKKAIAEVRTDLKYFKGKSVLDGLAAVSKLKTKTQK
jgi:carboxypeptidase T